MKKIAKKIIFLSILFTYNLSFSQAGWRILSDSNTPVVSDNLYHLQDIVKKYHLKYQSRNKGINLGWGKTSYPNIKFVSEGGGEIKCGDKIAIYVENGGFLMYKQRPHGINLVWSKTPIYEWELRNVDNKKGTAINTNEDIGIYNKVEDDFARYCVRVKDVINISWSKDCCDGYTIKCEYDKWKPYVMKAIKYGAPLLL